MPDQWNVVGSSKFTKEERDLSVFRLDGDVSTLIVPLRWPVAKVIRRRLALATAALIEPFWVTLIVQSEMPVTLNGDPTPGYVPFPPADELHEIYFKASGERFDPFPWDDPEASELERGAEPKTWAALFTRWYQEQFWYDDDDLVKAFGEAVEVLTGLPLEPAEPSPRSSTPSTATGGAVSASKPASTSTKKKTPPPSSPPPTTSSPAA